MVVFVVASFSIEFECCFSHWDFNFVAVLQSLVLGFLFLNDFGVLDLVCAHKHQAFTV